MLMATKLAHSKRFVGSVFFFHFHFRCKCHRSNRCWFCLLLSQQTKCKQTDTYQPTKALSDSCFSLNILFLPDNFLRRWGCKGKLVNLNRGARRFYIVVGSIVWWSTIHGKGILKMNSTDRCFVIFRTVLVKIYSLTLQLEYWNYVQTGRLNHLLHIFADLINRVEAG